MRMGNGNPMVMDCYDGNTVTVMWNFAQHFALNDNFFGTTDGPSTIGTLNLVSGQTHGATQYKCHSKWKETAQGK
jgi:phospholipase C